jgi:hypothetical protein
MSHLFNNIKTQFLKNERLLFLNISVLCLCVPFPANVSAANNFYYDGSIKIDRIYAYTSFYTKHFSPQPEHVNEQNMFGLEFRLTNKRMYGLALFDNSFGQKSEYLYTGYKWRLSDRRIFSPSKHYLKLTGGLLHGYRGEYQDKIPLNDLGVAPAIIPSYSYQYKNYMTDVVLGGASVITITFGFIF